MSRCFVLLLLVACGSSAEPGSSDSTGGEEGPCPSELSECYDADSRAECLEVARTCAAENIVQLESCPVQYACDEPSVAPADGDEPVASDSGDTCAGYSVTDSCMNEENFAECQAAEAECPGSVAVMESCPLQFACER